jgi:chromosomal replication initiator protein
MMYSLTAPILNFSGILTTIAHPKVAVRPRMTIARIQEVVSRHYGIDVRYMKSAQRGRDVARPRQIAMFLAKELTPKSLPCIGQHFGNRDHTTVMHAIKRVNELCLIDGEIADDIDALRERLAA